MPKEPNPASASTTVASSVDLRWLSSTSAPTSTPAGAAFGVPWKQGQVDRTTPFQVSGGGKGVPVQSWPLAYWPDGSLKWTGHALPANAGLASSVTISPGTPVEPQDPVSVKQGDDGVTVTTGSFVATIPKSGTTLLKSLSLSSIALAQSATLVLLLQSGPDPDFANGSTDGTVPGVTKYEGKIESVTVEQSGPVRAVIKVTGKYTDSTFPFTVRIYISAGATTARIVHFFIYDGDQTKDFIKGLGLQFTTPLKDELYNRHIRFVNSPPPPASTPSSSSDPGIWGEPVRVVSGLRRDATAPVLNAQFEGTATPDISTWPTSVSGEIDQLAVWNDFSLAQLHPSAFTIKKRSTGGVASSWIDHAGFGAHASGVAYVGGATGGGVVVGMKDFWQGAPRSIDIRGAGTDNATTCLWAWSPLAPAMDMRHYDVVPHGLDLTYEDVGDPDPNPVGIGRSYEVTLQLFASTPSRKTLGQLAVVHTDSPQLVSTPEFYASMNLFGGRWNVPDTSRSGLAAIEKRKSDLLDFYVKDIDQRTFYGFWHYGDVMHTYDQTRHVWRYDVGGFAWDNGELSTDLWLWMSFLRTGRLDIFQVARAMTRHLSEVDFHHTGPFAGLGSRHNVSHWGDGAKEARVAGSSLKRPFYYLLVDELMGDIMDFSLQADQTIMTWDPLRKVLPPPDPAGPGRLRIGPDWTTLVGNWFVKWERTNDTKWRDRIKVGMNDIGGFKFGLFTGNGAAVGWNADTAHLVDEGGEGEGSYHLMMVFGGGEILMELMELITDEPAFDAAWLDFCRLYNASNAEKLAKYGKSFSSSDFPFPQYYAKLQAYAGQRMNDTSIKQAAWTVINNNTVGVWAPVQAVGGTDVLNPIEEIPNLGTNDAGQLSLNEYAVMAIAPELSPNSFAEWDGGSVTVAGDEEGVEKDEAGNEREVGRRTVGGRWRRLICL